jgi:hypothetical protein
MTKKGKKRATADVGLMFTAYNLRRILNILDHNLLQKFLKDLVLFVLEKTNLLKPKRAYLSPLNFCKSQSLILKHAA